MLRAVIAFVHITLSLLCGEQKQNRTHGYIMKLKRVIGVVGLVAVYCGPGLFFILAVALGVNIGVALFITLGIVSLRLEYGFLTFAGTD